MQNAAFPRLHLTDAGIMEMAGKGYLVITEDLKLATHLDHLSLDVINFNHVRTYGWSS